MWLPAAPRTRMQRVLSVSLPERFLVLGLAAPRVCWPLGWAPGASEPLCPWGSLSFHPVPVFFPDLAVSAVINVAGECDKRTDPGSSVPAPLTSPTPLVAHPGVSSRLLSTITLIEAHLISGFGGVQPSLLRGGEPSPSRGPCAGSSLLPVRSRCLSLCFLGVCGAGRGLSARGAGGNGAGHPACVSPSNTCPSIWEKSHCCLCLPIPFKSPLFASDTPTALLNTLLFTPACLCLSPHHVTVPGGPPGPAVPPVLIPGEAGGEYVWDKCIFITRYDWGFRELLARQMDLRVLRVLTVCVPEQGVEKLRNQRKHHCGHPVDFTEHAGDRGTIQVSFVYFFFLSEEETLDSNLESFK
ncbi:HSD17B6, partial [Cervus elaphus hippelaphus]